MSKSKLFSPIQVGGLELQHRLVLAPLTRLRSPKHIPDVQLLREYYSQRAQRPGTLLITEGTYINIKAGGMGDAPGIWSKEQIEAWKPVIQSVHDKKSYLFMQLWAMGRSAIPFVAQAEGWEVVGPSPVKYTDSEGDLPIWAMGKSREQAAKLDPVPHELTKTEIKEYVKWFAQGAKNAVEAGADGVEIHGANGYLLDQFLHPNTNKRTDEYGGSIENRARFTLEVIDAVSEAIGSQKVAIRLSPWSTFGNVHFDGSPIPQFSYVVDEIENRKKQGKELAYVHIVEPRVNLMVMGEPEAPNELNDFVAQIYTGTIIRSGALVGKAAEFIDKHPERTLVAGGRYFISNPDLVDKLENGTPLTKYDRSTFYSSGAKGYTDYPNGQK